MGTMSGSASRRRRPSRRREAEPISREPRELPPSSARNLRFLRPEQVDYRWCLCRPRFEPESRGPPTASPRSRSLLYIRAAPLDPRPARPSHYPETAPNGKAWLASVMVYPDARMMHASFRAARAGPLAGLKPSLELTRSDRLTAPSRDCRPSRGALRDAGPDASRTAIR